MLLRWSLVLLVAACGRLGFETDTPTLVFVDGDQAAFDRGTYDAGPAVLAWRDGQLTFASEPPFDPSQIGIYVSQPFETGDDRTVWDTLAWVPTGPQGRPLADGGAPDDGYAEGGVNMADNILLLHLDGAGAPDDASTVADASGHLHHGRIVLAGQTAQHVAGEFNQALDLQRDAWVSLDGSYFDLGTSDFTYAIWVKMFDCAQSNDNRVAMGGAGASDTPHMWIGALCPDPCASRDGAFMNFLDSSRVGPSLSACTGVVLDDGAWHHLAGVKQGHTAPAALVRLYVDGREVAADSFDFGATTFTYDGGEIRLGSFNLNDPQYHTRIIVDEAAIWKRTLDAAEIAALYRRGAVGLELQFRVCPDRVCDTEPFLGPDGTSGTYFTEADLAGAAGGQRDNLSALGLVGSVAQYRVRFSTAATLLSPGLVRVSLEAALP